MTSTDRATRTPGTWYAHGFGIDTADDRLVATAYAGIAADAPYGIPELHIARANAAHIVLCVNAHDALVEALQAVDADGLPAPQRKLVAAALKLAGAE